MASECSSTISSEEEPHIEVKEEEQQPPILESAVTINDAASKESSLVPPLSPTNSSISSDEEDGGTWHTPTNQTTPVKIKEAVRYGFKTCGVVDLRSSDVVPPLLLNFAIIYTTKSYINYTLILSKV